MTTLSRMPIELPVAADRSGPVPLTEQICDQLRAALADGRLSAGERLPSSRALAATLGVSRTVVTTAYTQLFAEGWLEGRHGSGTYVAEGAPGSPAAGPDARPAAGPSSVPPLTAGPAAAPALTAPAVTAPAVVGAPTATSPLTVDPVTGRPLPVCLRPGIPWSDGVDRAAWRRAWRYAGAQPLSAWPDPHGLPALRHALTGYLRRGRGLRCGADQVLITRGVSAALSLIALALLRPGDRVGVEEPGYRAAWRVFAVHGVELVPCPVDADGLVVDELPAGLRLIYTTPAHQYPLGGRLPVPRRRALLAWAHATGALILEDDYDGEFRYDVAPLPTLVGLDPEVVIYLGTTSKTLTPTLGAGWLVARPDLVALLAERGAALGQRVPEPVQHAVTELLASGDLERHVRRMRHEYARRRAVMAEILGAATMAVSRDGPEPNGQGPAGPAAAGQPLRTRLTGDTAGMHMVLELPRGVVDDVAAAARARGVDVATLDGYFTGPARAHGLVLGYGAADLAAVSRGSRVIAAVLGGLTGA
jgi:GntR family transcriptional regulator/MocR family aminotransferase